MGASLDAVTAQVERMLAGISTAWAAHDFDYLRRLWSLSPDPLIYLAEEETGFVRSHGELDAYFTRTAAGIHEVRGDYRLDTVTPLSGALYNVTFRVEWAAREKPGDEMIAGTCRGYMVVEQTADGVHPRVYVEAPRAPILYIRELYALVAKGRGLS